MAPRLSLSHPVLGPRGALAALIVAASLWGCQSNTAQRAASPLPAAPPPRYRITPVSPLPGNKRSSARALNDRGQVLAVSGSSDSGSSEKFVLWDHGKPQDLGLRLGKGDSAHVSALNNRGQVVGYLHTFSESARCRPFLWEAGKVRYL